MKQDKDNHNAHEFIVGLVTNQNAISNHAFMRFIGSSCSIFDWYYIYSINH